MSLIQNVLIPFKKKEGETPTHTIIPNPNNTYFKHGASFVIPSDEIKRVYTELHNYFFNDYQRLSLTESFGEYCPLIFDLDIKYENVEKKRYYTNNELCAIVDILWKNIKKYFDLTEDNQDECWITEKADPHYDLVENNLYNVKDGIHIIFPNIIGDRKVFKEFMKFFTEEPIVTELTNIFEVIPSNDISSIIDTNVQRWFVYGDGKNGRSAYLLTHIIHCNTDCNTLIPAESTGYENLEIMNKLCLLQDFVPNVEYKNDIDNILNSIPRNSSSISILNMVINDNDESYNPYSDEEDGEYDQEFIKLTKKVIKSYHDYCDCLTNKYYEYGEWIKVGMCLKNIGGDQLFDVFDKFSQNGSNYKNSEDILKYWKGWKQDQTRGYQKEWLQKRAKESNPDKYENILRNDIEHDIDMCVKEGGHHDDIANIVYHYFKNDYICIDLKEDWYYFKNHRWERCPRGYLLQRELTSTIKKIFKFKRNEYEDKSDSDCNGTTKWEDYAETAGKIYTKLKDVCYQKNIMEACRNKFYKPCMMELFDANTRLLGFENCVFDLDNNLLREGYSDDYITMSTKLFMPVKQNELPITVDELWDKVQHRSDVKYKKEAEKREKENPRKSWMEYIEEEWDKGEPRQLYFKAVSRDIQKFFTQIMPDPELKEYTLRYIASRLCGDVQQRFSVWTGCGGNGKSMLIDLIQAIMGDYCKNLPVSLLTQRRKASNSASPEKAVTKGVRICHMAEPDTNERINVGEMKELSGGDTIQARKLYGDVFEFKPQFEIVLMCNEKPTIDDKTNGAWRRVLVTPFVSRFTDDKTKLDSNLNIFPRNKNLPNQIKNYWPVIFMTMVLKQWVLMSSADDEYRLPEQIRLETETYKNSNDILGQWIREGLDESKNPSEFNDLYENFIDWYDGDKRIDKQEIKGRLISWQKESVHGYSDGVNGTMNKPIINLVSKE